MRSHLGKRLVISLLLAGVLPVAVAGALALREQEA